MLVVQLKFLRCFYSVFDTKFCVLCSLNVTKGDRCEVQSLDLVFLQNCSMHFFG